MKRKYITRAAALIMTLTLIFSFSGCGKTGNTIDEPSKITVDYLTGEYAEQLVRDGAEITLGTVELEADENGAYTATINNMVIVESDITDAGYYIADANVTTTSPVDPAARITYISDAGAEPEIITPEEFAEIVSDENYDPLQEGNEKLYDVYSIGGTVLMILAKELPSALN